jgi:ribosome modulation factor
VKGFERAVQRGRDDYNSGRTLDQCPYRDKRTWQGKATFSRAWRNAWRDGWTEAQREKHPVQGPEHRLGIGRVLAGGKPS